MALVELKEATKNFGGVRALRRVSIGFNAGEVHALLGENGAGKSTLIKVVAGVIQPDSGELYVKGEKVRLLNPRVASSYGIAVVHQEPMIFTHLSVLENIYLGREVVGSLGLLNRSAMLRGILPIAEGFGFERNLLSSAMGELSIGYQQIALIMKALMQNAEVLIFDEPTSILSQSETGRLFSAIERLRSMKKAIVYITHRLDEVERIANRVTVLTDGRVVGTFDAGEIDSQRIIQLMSGRRLKAEKIISRNPAEGTARPADKLSSVMGEQPVLYTDGLDVPGWAHGVSWRIFGGEVTGIYGLVGSGRSEVALSIFGLIKFSSGSIWLKGKRVNPRSPAEAIRLGIGYLPEDRKIQGLFFNKAVEVNITSPRLPDFMRSLNRLDLRGLYQLAKRLVDAYRVKTPDVTTQVGTLSGGNQQKVLFSRWAGKDLEVLILDEPTRGIDVASKAEIHDFIFQLVRKGLAVVVITSDLEELLTVSDHVYVMHEGTVMAELRGDQITEGAVLTHALGSSLESQAG